MARVSLPHGGFAKTTMPNTIFAAPTNAKTKAKGKKVCKRPAAHLQEEEEDEEQQVCKRPAAGLQELEAQKDDEQEEEEDQINDDDDDDDDDDDEDDADDDEAGPDWSHLDKNTLSELEGGWQAWREKKERRRQLEKEQRKEEKKQRKPEKQERKQEKKEPICKKRPASGLVAKEQAKRSRSGRMSAEEVNDVLDCWDEFLLETKNTSQQEEVQDKEEQDQQANQEEEQEDQAEQEEEQDEEDEEEEEEPNPTEGPPVDVTPEREEGKEMEANDRTQLITRLNMVVRSRPKNSAYLMGFVRRDLPKVYIGEITAQQRQDCCSLVRYLKEEADSSLPKEASALKAWFQNRKQVLMGRGSPKA